MRLIFIVLFIIIGYFAYKKEKVETSNIYTSFIMKDSDTSNKLKRKLMGLLSYNKSAIKWRRSFICSLISTFLIFTLVYFRVPTVKELVLFILIIYIVYYSLWIDFVEKVSNKVEYHGKNIIKHLKS